MKQGETAAKPRLVIVAGSPGSGKSTLAEQLAEKLGNPLLMRDDLKEAMMDVLPVENLAESQEMGQAALDALCVVLEQLVGKSIDVVVESSFTRGRGEDELAGFTARTRPVQVYVTAPADLIVTRYKERMEKGERHPGHQDEEALPDLIARLERDEFGPLDLDLPLIEVDSTDGFKPHIDEIVQNILGATE